MSSRTTRIRQDKEYNKDNAILKTAIYPTVLVALITDLTGSITTAVSNVETNQTTPGTTKTHSSVIDPYDTRLMNLNTE